MATFYIQLENRLRKISGELTSENIIKALGYTPSDFSGNFNDLMDNPLTQDDNGEFKIVDESGNIIVIVDSEGIHSIDFVAGDHKLSDKANKSEIPSLNGYATESWVENKGYAKQKDLDNIDFNTLKNTPFLDNENGELNIVDENNNIGLRLNNDGLYVKDVIAGNNILSNKVDKEKGKGLSTEDFTTALKEKLQGLSNYDDTEIDDAVKTLRNDLDTLVSGDTTTAIEAFNEIIAFLEGVEDTESLSSIIASIEKQIAKSATKAELNDLDFYNIKNNPIIDDGDGKLIFADENGNIGLKLDNDNNLIVKDVIAGDNILSNKVDKTSLSKSAISGSYNDLNDKPTIPSAVTESTVSGWGFTKNTGNYSKPSGGIPKSDLASAVQTSLNKADTALQSHQDISGKINGNGTITKIVKVSALPDNPDTNTLYIIV